jgi:subtilisin family serine protease
MPWGISTDRSGAWGVRRRAVLGLAAATLAAGMALATPVRADNSDQSAKTLLVRFDGDASATAVERAVAAAGGRIDDIAGSTGFVRVSTGSASAAGVQAALAASPVVDVVEPNRTRRASLAPNDPRYAGQTRYLDTVRLPEAWNTTVGNDSMILAIIDSGVELNHPDLAPRLVGGYDFVNNDATPNDDFGHGTMVAGIAAAVTNNGEGVAGGAWSGRIMPIKVLDSNGAANDDDIAAGITFAVDHGARVINLSLGGPGESNTLQAAVNYATSRNVVVIAAAGNDGQASDIRKRTLEHYPAACAGVIAVGSTDASGNHSPFSSYGSWIDVVAPGQATISPSVGISTTVRGSTYGTGSGTSFSAPLVAATAFLMRSANPAADQATISLRLIGTARDIGTPGVDSVFGAGMIDAVAAVEASGGGFSSASTNGSGYWMLGQQGAVYRFGGAGYLGDVTRHLASGVSAADLEPTPSGGGYWIVSSAGSVYGFGDAAGRYFGGAAGQLRDGEQVTSLSTTPTGNGYWLFTSLGRVFNFGAAAKLGDLGHLQLNGPILDSIPTPSGQGYYMVGSDGGIFAFGDARFAGSMGGKHLNAPVQSLVPDPDGGGYWLVAADGGVFAFDAAFRGSMGSVRLNAPVSGMVPFGNGYLMVATDGGAFNFSDQAFSGSLAGSGAVQPIIAVATKVAAI